MDILDTILADTRERLELSRVKAPVGALELLPPFRAPTLSLRESLRKRRFGIIAEIKKASPSKGVIRSDFDVPAIARAYRTAGAAAISVLTEPEHFSGSLDHLEEVRMVVDLPILRKDFIIDPYQVVEARAWGADAILLIAAALDRNQLTDLMQAAQGLGMEALVEVHDPSELDDVDLDSVSLLGVNNRNLKTMRVDVQQTMRILELVPSDLTVVSESGIRTADQLVELDRRGAGGFLIGTAFMKSRKPGRALESLLADANGLSKNPSKLRLVAT